MLSLMTSWIQEQAYTWTPRERVHRHREIEREREGGGFCSHSVGSTTRKAPRRQRRRTSNHFARSGGLLGGTRAEHRQEGRRPFTAMAMSALHRLARSQLQHSRNSAALLTISSRSASNVSALLRDLLWWNGMGRVSSFYFGYIS